VNCEGWGRDYGVDGNKLRPFASVFAI